MRSRFPCFKVKETPPPLLYKFQNYQSLSSFIFIIHGKTLHTRSLVKRTQNKRQTSTQFLCTFWTWPLIWPFKHIILTQFSTSFKNQINIIVYLDIYYHLRNSLHLLLILRRLRGNLQFFKCHSLYCKESRNHVANNRI